jgi:hypothetical protein
MTKTNSAADITITKGNGRYNIAVDGISAGWTYKNSNGTWSVRINRTKGDFYTTYAEVIAQETSRTMALNMFAIWIRNNPYFMSFIQDQIAADAAADAWLASL